MLALERFLEIFAVLVVGLCAGVGARVIWLWCSPPPTDIDDLLRRKPDPPRVIGRIPLPNDHTTSEKQPRIH